MAARLTSGARETTSPVSNRSAMKSSTAAKVWLMYRKRWTSARTSTSNGTSPSSASAFASQMTTKSVVIPKAPEIESTANVRSASTSATTASPTGVTAQLAPVRETRRPDEESPVSGTQPAQHAERPAASRVHRLLAAAEHASGEEDQHGAE